MRRTLFAGLRMVVLAAAAASCASGAPAATEPPRAATATPSPEPVPVAASATPRPSETAPAARTTFVIVPEESEVRFVIEEILAGSPKTVVGTTSAVQGSIAGDFADPASAAIDPIVVDLSTLRTDNSFRNRAIHDAILQTGIAANRYAVFEVDEIGGLPGVAVPGTSYELSLTGDLTIHGVTRRVTFAATVTPVSPARLEGTARLTIPYGEFDVRILRLPPQVASVGDLVTLEIDFVAVAGEL